MINKPSVSVIFLCHNNKDISVAIDCVLEQIDSDDEIIIVDDHSNLQTHSILEKYSENTQILILNATKIANRSHNRNIGARAAKNTILLFLDGDMVLGNNSIRELKYAHGTREEKAFIGPKHGIHFNDIQMRLYSSIPNYVELLETKEGREQLESNPLFLDSRYKYFEDPNTEKYRWAYYYTGLCSVEKSIFEHVGGFDENFSSWGAEDIDFGYRINRVSKIGFIKELHGFHIPHMRDVINNEVSNIGNYIYMLQKYKTWEFEVSRSFYGYGNLLAFEKILSRMRLLNVSDEIPDMNSKDILIDIISQKYPYGKIMVKNNTLIKVNSFWGVTIPFDNYKFDTAYVSDHIFIYPELITCRILQEALRIAKRVIIYPTIDSIRISWDEIDLMPKAQKQHLHYEANDLLTFTFIPTEKNYIEVKYIGNLSNVAFTY